MIFEPTAGDTRPPAEFSAGGRCIKIKALITPGLLHTLPTFNSARVNDGHHYGLGIEFDGLEGRALRTVEELMERIAGGEGSSIDLPSRRL